MENSYRFIDENTCVIQNITGKEAMSVILDLPTGWLILFQNEIDKIFFDENGNKLASISLGLPMGQLAGFRFFQSKVYTNKLYLSGGGLSYKLPETGRLNNIGLKPFYCESVCKAFVAKAKIEFNIDLSVTRFGSCEFALEPKSETDYTMFRFYFNKNMQPSA